MNNSEILEFVEQVLTKVFSNIPQKQVVDESDRKLNFSCPICGDSKKKYSKRRGNIYFDSGAYKCFNDGCMAYMSLGEFVAKMSKEHGIMLPSFVTELEYKPIVIKRDENPLLRFITSDTSEILTLSEIINRFSLVRADSISKNSNVHKYLESRNLTTITNYGDVLYADQSDNKLLIFNLDKGSGKILGFSIRNISEYTQRKYIIKTYTDIVNIYLNKQISEELINDANYLNNYFNILNIDFTKDIAFTEGQFDAMLLDNCIASTGVTKAYSILELLDIKPNVKILFDRDKAGKTEMLDMIKNGYSVLLWNKLISDLRKKYSTKTDLVDLSKIKDINDLYSFLYSKNSNYNTKEFNSWINQYYSNSQFDIIYV